LPRKKGLSDAEQQGLGSLIASLFQNSWASNNFSARNFDQAGTAVGKGFRDATNWVTSGIAGLFGNYRSAPGVSVRSNADIHMPTQHSFLGINMTALSEGNFLQQTIYGVANGVINIPVQYIMGRGVGGGSMRNLDGTATSTDEGVLSFGTLPLFFTGAGQGISTVRSGGMTFAEYRTSYWASRAKPILDPIVNRETGQIWNQYMELHHRFIPRRWKLAYNWLKNNRLNLQELNSLEHSMKDPYRARFAPKWVKEQYNLMWK
jgi:hypothetical protein